MKVPSNEINRKMWCVLFPDKAPLLLMTRENDAAVTLEHYASGALAVSFQYPVSAQDILTMPRQVTIASFGLN